MFSQTEKMSLMEEIKNTFMTSIFPPTLFKPITKSISKLSDICSQRLKLYQLLQKAAHDCDVYSEQWTLHLVKELAKEQFEHFFALLDPKKTSELLVNSLAECKADELTAELNSMESTPNKAREPVTNSLLEDYFMDDAIGHLFFGLMSSEANRWLFIDMEIQWFHLKFNLNVPEVSMIDFLTYNNLAIPEKASKEEILSMTNLLSIYELDFESDIPPIILKLPFDAAPKLIINRTVVLIGGIMYFPNKREYIRVMIDHYLKFHWMNRVTKQSQRWLSAKNQDERYNQLIFDVFTPLLENILYYGNVESNGVLTVGNINEHAIDLFPLCMSEIHNSLQENSHLHHFARKQYAVFLKHAGMSYEDAMTFFQSEFTKKITREEFRKQRHEYYFSHCYGRVGSYIDYLVQSCEEIINYETPSGKQEHGCPFAHADEKSLTNILQKRGIGLATITEIINSKKNKQYREACCLYFTEKNERPLALSVNSPNAYYACALENFVDIEDIFQ